jgi:hypothetical protein
VSIGSNFANEMDGSKWTFCFRHSRWKPGGRDASWQWMSHAFEPLVEQAVKWKTRPR